MRIQVPYSTPGRALLKTTMGMLGEYEYDTVYNDHVVPPVTWILYVAFLVTNCVIIMNLLVSDNNKVIFYRFGCTYDFFRRSLNSYSQLTRELILENN